MYKLYLYSIFLFTANLFCIAASGQSYRTETDEVDDPHFYIQAGGFFPAMQSDMRIDSERGVGTDFSLENNLRLKADISAFRFSVMYRLKKKSQFQFTYTALNRSKSLTLDRDIVIGDTTFYANANLDVKFDVNYFGLTWRYSFFNEPNWNAGLSFGLRVLQFNTGFSATLNNQSYESKPTAWAPAVLVGLHGSGYLTPKLLARTTFEYFQATIIGIKVYVIETQISLQYFIIKNLGVGAGYATTAYEVHQLPLDDNFTGKIDFSFQGFTLFATARF